MESVALASLSFGGELAFSLFLWALLASVVGVFVYLVVIAIRSLWRRT